MPFPHLAVQVVGQFSSSNDPIPDSLEMHITASLKIRSERPESSYTCEKRRGSFVATADDQIDNEKQTQDEVLKLIAQDPEPDIPNQPRNDVKIAEDFRNETPDAEVQTKRVNREPSAFEQTAKLLTTQETFDWACMHQWMKKSGIALMFPDDLTGY